MLAWWLIASPGWAAPPESPPVHGEAKLEITALRQVIDDQIAAFRRQDAPGAWRHVSPGLQAQFGTADRFLELVRDHYAPVYAPVRYDYGEIVPLDGMWGQWLDVVGPDGQRVRALYLMQQQADGTWRTNGCLLYPPGDAPPSV